MKLERRIVGGVDAWDPYIFPFMAALRNNNELKCGGARVNVNKVVTLASCFFGNVEEWTSSDHRIDLEKTDKEENGHTYSILSTINHPKFVRSTGASYDISVWTLNVPDDVYLCRDYSIEFETDTNVNYNEILIFGGWGEETWKGYNSDHLLVIYASPVKEDRCNDIKNFNSNLQMCVGGDEARDACGNDFGGPLFRIHPDDYSVRFTLVGLIGYSNLCGIKDQPRAFTKVSAMENFLQDNCN